MEKVSYSYDPVRDICAVEQVGFIDLTLANQTSSVPASLVIEEHQYNGIEDPRSIGARPRDVFETAQANKVIAGYVPPKDESQAE